MVNMLLSCQMTIINFAEWLDKELAENDLSQADLAKLSKVDPSIISRAIKMERLPSPENLNSIARALRKPPELVFREAGLLPPSNINNQCEELNYLFAQLPERDQAEILEIIRIKLDRHELLITELKKKYNPWPPGDDQVMGVIKDYLQLLGIEVAEGEER